MNVNEDPDGIPTYSISNYKKENCSYYIKCRDEEAAFEWIEKFEKV
ncbi:hypothetical protein KP77_28250 [Jeotgalibacillus alimentarius]|uniref:Uncharacterized protein n=1 Tax=Jeotgalibacillus alimentarius TaxID=135826 RepID=A0A0C2VRS6_9BACL|nr:hypothetical protein KP77_28250 [Jeotgalibacillus alimentarius]